MQEVVEDCLNTDEDTIVSYQVTDSEVRDLLTNEMFNWNYDDDYQNEHFVEENFQFIFPKGSNRPLFFTEILVANFNL